MQLKTSATKYLFALILSFCSWLCVAHNYVDNSLLWQQLTPQQQEYLQLLPKLRVSVQADYAPISFKHNEQYIGLGIDFLNMLTKALNISLNLQHSENIHSAKAFNQGLVDIVVNVNPNDRNYHNAHVTQPFVDLPLYTLTRQGEYQHINNLDTLKQQTLVVINADPVTPIIKKMLPDNKIITVPNINHAFEALNNLSADVFIYPKIMLNYYINRLFITEFELSQIPAFIKSLPFKLSIITHQDNKRLNDILDIAIASISPQQLDSIKFNWQTNHTQKLMQSMQLTKEEQLALNSQPNVVVGMLDNSPPFSFVEQHKRIGFTKTLMELIAVKLNINVEYRYASWSELLQLYKNKQIDLLTDITETTQRRSFTLFTKPYIAYKNMIVTRRTNQLKSMNMDDIQKLTIVLLKGHFISEYFERNYPHIKKHYVLEPHQAYQAILNNQADILIGNNIRHHYHINKEQLTNLKIIDLVYPPLNHKYSNSIGVNLDRPLLRSAIDKAIISISSAELRQLRQRWFNVHDDIKSPKFSLSVEQLKWLYQVNQISVYKPNLELPLGKWYNNQYTGVFSSFIAQLENAIGLNWYNVAHSNWQSADITIASPSNQTVAKQFNFTAPISKVPVVIITANPELPFIDNIENLSHSNIAVVKTHQYYQQIKRRYPNAKVLAQNSLEEAVQKVSQGQIEILLCPLITCSYVINQQGASHLRILGQTELHQTLAFAINKNNPMLHSIISNLLSNISEKQKDWFYHQWHNENIPVNNTNNQYSYFIFATLCGCFICFFAYRRYLLYKRYKQAEQYAASMQRNNNNLKQAQSKLVHAEKMASLGTLTAGVAHEINNPTNFVHVGVQNLRADIIKTQEFFIELAGNDADPEIIDSFKEQFIPILEHIATISTGTDKIKAIVQDLRAFTRTDSKDKNPIDLNNYIQSTVNLVTTKCVEMASIQTKLNDIPYVPCHPAQINQVLMSLIVNSFDAITIKHHAKQKSSKQQKSGAIIISTDSDQKNIIITVSDNGCGMNKHTQKHLFEPFYTTKNNGEGSGLGLAMAASIIADHQGTISLVSSDNRGTCMKVTLPLCASQPAANPPTIE